MATKVKPSRLQVSGTPQAGQVPVYVNEDCFQWCDSGGCAQWGCITGTLCDQTDLQGALDCKQDKACMVCNLTSPDDSHYPTSKAVADAMACAGVGDMLKSVYDPNNIQANVYDYCNFVNTPTIPTNNNQLANGCGYTTCTGTLVASDLNPYATCVYVNDSINSVTAYYITKNAQGDQWATYAELAAASTFYSGGVQRTPTKNDYTIVLDDENHDHATTRYIYNSGWEYQYTVNETALTQSQLDALNSGITAAKVSAYDGYATSKQDALTASANIDITCNKISATNNYIITEAITCTTYTGTVGVAPYNTSYCYTNICINPDSGVARKEGSVYTFDIDTEMIATSACRNVRVKIGDGAYIPVMGTSSILAGSTYFTKANTRQYMYSTKYQSCGALHLFTDSNTTYSAMSNAEATTGTCTSGRSIAACTLKCAINYYAPISDTAYGSSWDGKTTTAPSQNAVYDKIESVVSSIPTNNNQLTNGCGYTTCTGTISTCAQIISTLGYTPYNATNPNGYTTCTGTLVPSSLKTVNGCCLVGSGDICIQGGGGIQMCPTSPTCITYKWIGSEAEYCNLGTYCPGVEYNIY